MASAFSMRGVSAEVGRGSLPAIKALACLCYPSDVIASVLLVSAGVLVVDPSNHAPEWDAATPKEQTGNDTTAIHFVVRATDADNDPLTYNLSGLPTGAKAEASEGAVQVSWTPTAD